MSDARKPGEIAEYEQAETPVRDGIGEEDHPIPLWFNLSFFGTIVFAAVYLVYYTAIGWSSAGQWSEEVARAEAAKQAVLASQPATNPYHGDATAIAEGKQTFDTICAACHKPDATGLVGPSLVDPYWKYGAGDADLFHSVMEGRPAGMPAWGPQLGSEKVWKVLAYLETLPKSETSGVGAPDYIAPTASAAPAN